MNKSNTILISLLSIFCVFMAGFVLYSLFMPQPKESQRPHVRVVEVPTIEEDGVYLSGISSESDEIKMNPGTRGPMVSGSVVTAQAEQENFQETALVVQTDAPEVVAGPANALPTDEQIEASIIEQNTKALLAKKLRAQTDRKVEKVSKGVRSLSQNQLSPETPTKISENQKPSAQMVEKVRSGEYIYN